MSVRLVNRFAKERLAGNHLFVPFITAGDRGLDFTKKAILALGQAGADAIELGVPFSDPIADGAVIQHSSQRALDKGTTLEQILEVVAEIRGKTDVPILLMGYLNPFLSPSLKHNLKKAAKAGVDGLIIPDIPPEESEELITISRQTGLDTVFLAAPTSTEERLEAIGHLSTGYVYYVSVAGTTGMRASLPSNIKQGVNRVRAYTPLPVLVGFGIAKPEQAKAMIRFADGVIVGSALVKAMENGKDDQEALNNLTKLAKSIVKAVKS